MKKIDFITDTIMTFGEVEILGKVENTEFGLARLETIKTIMRNAFIPLSVRKELEMENNNVKGDLN